MDSYSKRYKANKIKELEEALKALPEMSKAYDQAKKIEKEWMKENPYRPGRKSKFCESTHSATWASHTIDLYLGEKDSIDYDALLLLEKFNLDTSTKPTIDAHSVDYRFGHITISFWYGNSSRCKFKVKEVKIQTYDHTIYEVECS